MDGLIEAFLEPVAEAMVGILFEGSGSIGEEGWTESKCRVQTLFEDAVWWNATPE
jgi:hypothetical protein